MTFWKGIALSEAICYLTLWLATIILLWTSSQKTQGLRRVFGGWVVLLSGIASIILPFIALAVALYQLL